MRKETPTPPNGRKASRPQDLGLTAKDQRPRQSAGRSLALDGRSHRTRSHEVTEASAADERRAPETADVM